MPRRTKIVATLGPATDPEPALADLIAAGVDLVRVNFSHGNFDDHARRVERARAAASKAGRVVGVLGDLRGPKVRIERFASGRATLVEGEPFTLDPAFDAAGGTDSVVGVAYESLPRDVRAGDTLLLNDGLIALQVTGVEGTQVQTKVLTGGELTDMKGLNKLGGGLSAGALTAKDREDIRMAAKLGVDYLAVSFVRDRNDIAEAWDLLRGCGRRGSHRCQDRAAGSNRKPRDDHRRNRRRHGRARRPRGRGRLRGAHRPAEAHHRARARRRAGW